MKAIGARLWTYIRSYLWALLLSLCFVAIVGVLEAVTPFLIGLIFDTLLRASNTPVLTLPFIEARVSVTGLDGRLLLALLVAITAVKAIAEYSSVNMISYLGQGVVRDLRNDVFEKIVNQP